MTAIRLDTDELKGLARRIELDVSEPLRDVRFRVDRMLDRTQMCRQASEEFFRLSTPILRKVSASFAPSISHLQAAREKLSIAVKCFEEMDNASVGRQAALRADFPDWFWNRDFTLCLMMDITLGELAVFFPYGNLLGGNPEGNLSLFVSILQMEIKDARSDASIAWRLAAQLNPHSPEAESLLAQMDLANINPGTLEADLYLRLMDLSSITLEEPAEAEQFLALVTRQYNIEFDSPPPTEERTPPTWEKARWEQLTVAKGVVTLARKLGDVLKEDAGNAFKQVYGIDENNPMVFVWDPSDSVCAGAGGRCADSHRIILATMSGKSATDEEKGVNHILHELGHAFDFRSSSLKKENEPSTFAMSTQHMQGDDSKNPGGFWFNDRTQGFASAVLDYCWQQNPSTTGSEVFADMFTGWVQDEWETNGMPSGLPGGGLALTEAGAIRKAFMDQHMPEFIKIYVEYDEETDPSWREYMLRAFTELGKREANTQHPPSSGSI